MVPNVVRKLWISTTRPRSSRCAIPARRQSAWNRATSALGMSNTQSVGFRPLTWRRSMATRSAKGDDVSLSVLGNGGSQPDDRNGGVKVQVGNCQLLNLSLSQSGSRQERVQVGSVASREAFSRSPDRIWDVPFALLRLGAFWRSWRRRSGTGRRCQRAVGVSSSFPRKR